MKNDISKIAEKIESNMFYGDEEEYEPYMNYGALSDLKEKVGIEDFSYGFLVFAEKNESRTPDASWRYNG